MTATLKIQNLTISTIVGFCIFASLAIGVFTSSVSIFILLIIAIAATVIAVLDMDYLICLVLLSIVIAPEYVPILPDSLVALGGNSLHKLVILTFLIPYLGLRGIKRDGILPIFVYFLLVLLSFSLSSWYPDLDTLQPFKSFLGLTIGWVIFAINWNTKSIHLFLTGISLIAMISVVIGVAFHLMGIHDLYTYEWWNNSYRLQGSAGIPAYLAFLAFVGLAASVYCRIKNNKGYLMIILINIAILLATATRGAILAAVIGVIPFGFHLLYQTFQRRAVLQLAIVFATIFTVSAVTIPNLLERNQGVYTKDAIDSSGRLDAWDYFIRVGMVNPWFGRGLGAGTIANDSDFYRTLKVPHNEYIRIFVDNGFVGLGLVLTSMLIIFYRLSCQLQRSIQIYFFALITALFVYSFFDNTFSTAQFSVPFFWFLALIRTQSATNLRAV